MAQMCPAKSTIVPFKKQMYSSGSIILSYKDDKCICVSIHAPTRGATDSDNTSAEVKPVSIHAPTRGATNCFSSACYLPSCFNPRTHEGCDRSIFHLRCQLQRFNPRTHEGCDASSFKDDVSAHVVSIHAPTRGATLHHL